MLGATINAVDVGYINRKKVAVEDIHTDLYDC
jgi:hypothetical protein